MNNIVIKRCPSCPTVRSFAEEMVVSLAEDFGVRVQVVDGVTGEFAVIADGVPVIQRTGDTLPSPDEVEAAVRNAMPVGV